MDRLEEVVEVTQADRDAAANLLSAAGKHYFANMVRGGHADMWKEPQAFARHRIAALSAIEGAGFVVVPKEPTPEMIEAGRMNIYDRSGDTRADDIYVDMIAAATRKQP